MKIVPPLLPQNVESPRRAPEAVRPAEDPRTERGPDRVRVSESARFVESVRRAAREEEPVRPAEVARVRELVASGTYESTVDLERVLDGLLGDL